MLSFSNLSDRFAQLRQIIRCLAMQALVHRHPKLVYDSICHIEPMQLRVKQVCQAVVVAYFFVSLTTRAAAFMTSCNLSITDLGAPANSRLSL